jgi:hypothetical protein
MLSGYRDRETLDLHVEHNYSAWYADHDIDVRAAVISAKSCFCRRWKACRYSTRRR